MKRVLIVGTGGIGKRHVRGLLKTGRARLWAVEPDAAKLAEVLRDYDIQEGCADVREADLRAFDAAVICAPAHVHVSIGQVCADAGLPFLAEKPLAVTMEGVDRLIETVNRKGLVARVAYIRRTSPETIEMRNQIMAGRIGDLRLCYVNCSQEYPRYRPDFQRIYYAKKETGGGAILDAASHIFDLLQWIIGPVAEVASMYDCLQLPTREVEDTALLSLRFRNGCMAQININQFQKPNVVTIEMIGTKGNLMLDMNTLKFAGDDSGRWEEQQFWAGLRPTEAHEARFRGQADMFLDILEGKPGTLTTLEEARESLRVALAAKESYATKRIVQLD
jgi:predicted dehydrogenase